MKKKSTYTWLLLILSVALFGPYTLSSQNTYDARLRLSRLDTSLSIVCYDLEIANSSGNEWVLANFNISFFYNARNACYRTNSDSLLLDDAIYDNGINAAIASVTGSGIPYEDSLGFMRLGLSSSEGGIVMPTDTSWVPTIRTCFDLKFENITDPATCFEANFLGTGPNPFNVPVSILQEMISNTEFEEVLPRNIQDLIPNMDYNTCFVLEENTEILCGDGIDNDDDGLLDCMDPECGPGMFVINQSPIDCLNPVGRIEINGGSSDLMVSIDNGLNFSMDTIFEDLGSGNYGVVVRKGNISGCAQTSSIIFDQPDCSESDDLSCSDGIDNNGDGNIDCEDLNCLPFIDDVLVTEPGQCPLLNDGIIEVISGYPNAEYSIDSGLTFQPDPLFPELITGAYFVVIRNPVTGCNRSYDPNPVVINPGTTCMPLSEICSDGVDNDLDGLVDCDDDDCTQKEECLVIPSLYIPNIMSLNSATNNFVRISSAEPLIVRSFRIFDRWGNEVHRSVNSNTFDDDHIWYGRVQNQEVSTGVYTYHIQLDVNGVIINMADNITVIN